MRTISLKRFTAFAAVAVMSASLASGAIAQGSAEGSVPPESADALTTAAGPLAIIFVAAIIAGGGGGGTTSTTSTTN